MKAVIEGYASGRFAEAGPMTKADANERS